MFYSLLFTAYLTRTIRNILYHLFWWEKKEYRLDRMLVHLKETSQGFRWMINPISVTKWIILLMFVFKIELIAVWAVLLVYLIEAIKNIYELKAGWKIPPFKPRIIVIAITSFIALFIIVTQAHLNLPISFLIADKLLGIVIAFLIFISNLVFDYYKNIKIAKASEKIKQYKNLKVIGITGSYGKTTTKELTAQLLSEKYKVLKTLGSQNTDIGIAERILSSNLAKYDFFVCEMAAYKRGEIAQICSMLKPKIEMGVITGINEQHQSLFGNLENTQKAKFELIEAISKNGTAIFNSSSKHIKDMVDWAKQKKLKVLTVNESLVRKLPDKVHGTHFQENLSLAITAAKIAGISDGEIQKSVDKVEMPQKTMTVTKRGNVFLIDNTFNSNPDGVYAALEYLRNFKGSKVLVLQPLIELGKYTEEIHKKIGNMADQICNQIVLTNRNFNNYILEGVKERDSKISVGKLNKITAGVILFQGKEAEKYLNKYV